MNNDDLRNRLHDWDPAGEPGEPDQNLLARVRRRLDGAEGPAWTAVPGGGRAASFVAWIREMLGLPGWAPVAGLAGAAIAVAVVAWVAFSEPAAERPAPLPTIAVDTPPATGDDDATGAPGSTAPMTPMTESAAAEGTEPETQVADADTNATGSETRMADVTRPGGDTDVDPSGPNTESLPSTGTEAPDLVPAATAAPQNRPVQIVLTASNGTRVYWTHQPGSGS